MALLKLNRRNFLIGAGGTVLAVPFLESLLPRGAHAGAATPQKRLVVFLSDHGGVWNRFMQPDVKALTNTYDLSGGHTIRYGKLPISDTLSSVLTGSGLGNLVPKMNFIKGLDIPTTVEHTWGAAQMGDYSIGELVNYGGGHDVTFDTTLAKSVAFGGSTSRPLPVMRVGKYSVSYDVVNGAATALSTYATPRVLFNAFLSNLSTTVDPPAAGAIDANRTPIVDRVLTEYNDLLAGRFGDAKRLSRLDKQRLVSHVELIDQLDRDLRNLDPGIVDVGESFACTAPSDIPNITYSGVLSNKAKWLEACNQVMAAALSCNTSRIAVIKTGIREDPYSDLNAGYHGTVHSALGGNTTSEDSLRDEGKGFFANGPLPLAKLLDELQDANGEKLLDHSLVMSIQEFGTDTHYMSSMPIVTFGSAGGAFNTGYFIDYRDIRGQSLSDFERLDLGSDGKYLTGLLYNQFMVTLLRAYGATAAEMKAAHVNKSHAWLGYGLDYTGLRQRASLSAYMRTPPEVMRRLVNDDLPLWPKSSAIQP